MINQQSFQDIIVNYFKYTESGSGSEDSITILEHEVYQNMLQSNSEVEVVQNFFVELELRNKAIKYILGKDEIPLKMFENMELNNEEEYLKEIKSYFRLILDLRILKEQEIGIKHISLKELLFNVKFKDEVVDILNYNINKYYWTEIKKENFFDNFSFGIIFNNPKNFEIYTNIKNDIKKFILDNNKKEFDVNYIGSASEKVIKNKEYIEYINNCIEDDILNDLSVTIEYLKKANKYNKYKRYLIEAYNIFPDRKQRISFNYDKYNYSEKNIVSLELNFDLPEKELIKQLKLAHNKYLSSITDYELLFGQKKNKFKYEEISLLGNRTGLRDYLYNKKYANLKEDTKITLVKSNLLVVMLFFFDAIYLGVNEKNLDDILILRYLDFKEVDIISDKKGYFELIFKMIKNDNWR